MRGTWVVILGAVVVGVARGELENEGSTNVKPSDLKLLHEQHRTEALCKYCKKSELRMKSPLCKKCVENSQEISASNMPYLLGSPTDNSNEKSAKITNKLGERKTENPQKLNEDALAHLNSLKTNSNVRESFLRLIKSPFVGKQNMKTLQMPLATKTRATDINRLSQINSQKLRLRDSNPTVDEFLASFPSNVPSVLSSEGENNNKIAQDFNTNLQHKSFEDIQGNDLLETSRTKRLKDIHNLTHDDFANILKEALRSEENNNTETKMRNSNHTKQADNEKTNDSLKKELLNEILSKHILEISSESEEGLNISEIIGSPNNPETFSNENSNNTNHSISVSKLTTEDDDLTTDTTTQKMPKDVVSLTNNINDRNKLGTLYHSKFNYKKHPRERLQYRNKIWVMEKEPPKNSTLFENLDEILEKIAPELIKNKHTTDGNIFQNESSTETSKNTENILKEAISKLQTTTENSIILSQHLNLVPPLPTKDIKTDKPKTALEKFKEMRKQHFLSRHMNMNLKNSRLKSTDIYTTTESTFSITTDHNETDVDIFSDGSSLLGLANPTKNTNFETKIINTRSTKDTPTQEMEEDEIVIKNSTTEHILSKIQASTNKFNNLIKKVLPTKVTKLNTIHSHLIPKTTEHRDIFSKNLNMNPKINTNKYKNLAMSMKNNEAKEQLSNNDKEKRFIETEYNNDDNLNNDQFIENKINLPLILKHNKDGSMQLVLDISAICANCSNISNSNPKDEKYVFKRKTEDNLSKYPLNIFNILDKHNDQSSTNVNNYLQMFQDQNINADLKEKFYKYLINEQLYKFFETLNIPVESSAELHSYIDDLPDKAKNKLKQYLLNNISDYYTTKDGNSINEELIIKKQTEFMQSLLNKQKQNAINNIETTTEFNRISLQIKTEDDPQTNHLNYDDNNSLKSLIREVILKEIDNSKLCPVCNNQKCTCNNNDRIYFPRDDNYSDESRVIDKRHYNYVPNNENLLHFNSDGHIKKKYKIANNFLNWARDIVVPSNKKQ